MFYTTNELAALLRYKHPRTFLVALRNKTTPLLEKLWEARLPAKVGKRILWHKQTTDRILENK